LIAHPAIKKINFTGSSKVGSIISASAGKHLKPVLMELGGKASAIVMKDADLENAALQCTLGAFLNVSGIRTLQPLGWSLTLQTRLVKSACLLSEFWYIRPLYLSSNQFSKPQLTRSLDRQRQRLFSLPPHQQSAIGALSIALLHKVQKHFMETPI